MRRMGDRGVVRSHRAVTGGDAGLPPYSGGAVRRATSVATDLPVDRNRPPATPDTCARRRSSGFAERITAPIIFYAISSSTAISIGTDGHRHESVVVPRWSHVKWPSEARWIGAQGIVGVLWESSPPLVLPARCPGVGLGVGDRGRVHHPGPAPAPTRASVPTVAVAHGKDAHVAVSRFFTVAAGAQASGSPCTTRPPETVPVVHCTVGTAHPVRHQWLHPKVPGDSPRLSSNGTERGLDTARLVNKGDTNG